MEDSFDIPNALFRFEVPVSVGAIATFDVNWTDPVAGRGTVTIAGSSGDPLMTSATMTWSASNEPGSAV